MTLVCDPRFEAGGMLGAAVKAELLVAQTADTACLVRHIAATPAGISFVFVVRLRQPLPATAKRSSGDRFWDALAPLLVNPRSTSKSALRLHVDFSDGREFKPPDDLQHDGSTSDSQQAEFQYWLGALPPAAGLVRFVCDWPARGIHDARIELSGRPVHTAAKRAVPLFSTPPPA